MKEGKIVMLEINKIYCGDCLELMKELDDKSIDLVLTDPPYGQSLGYGRGQLGERYVKNDDNLDWLPLFSKNIWRILKDNTEALVFCQWRRYSVFEKYLLSVGFTIRTVAIWNKMNAGLSGGGYAEQYEQIIVLRKGEARENYYRGNVYNDNRLSGRPEHPTQKPVILFENLICMCSDENDLVLDPFIGSGTTAVACIRTNRNFIGFEINQDYVNIANKRIKYERSQLKLNL